MLAFLHSAGTTPVSNELLNNNDNGLDNEWEHDLRTFGWTLSTPTDFFVSNLLIYSFTTDSVKFG